MSSDSLKVSALIWSYGQIREMLLGDKKTVYEENVVSRNYKEAEKIMAQLKVRQEEMLEFWKEAGKELVKNPENLSELEDPGVYA